MGRNGPLSHAKLNSRDNSMTPIIDDNPITSEEALSSETPDTYWEQAAKIAALSSAVFSAGLLAIPHLRKKRAISPITSPSSPPPVDIAVLEESPAPETPPSPPLSSHKRALSSLQIDPPPPPPSFATILHFSRDSFLRRLLQRFRSKRRILQRFRAKCCRRPKRSRIRCSTVPGKRQKKHPLHH